MIKIRKNKETVEQNFLLLTVINEKALQYFSVSLLICGSGAYLLKLQPLL